MALANASNGPPSAALFVPTFNRAINAHSFSLPPLSKGPLVSPPVPPYIQPANATPNAAVITQRLPKPPRQQQQQHPPPAPKPPPDNGLGAADVHRLTITEATRSDDTVCCGKSKSLAHEALRYFSPIFRNRIARWNMSIPGIIMLAWEILVLLAGGLSIINVTIPSSPGIWAPFTILGVGIIYFLFFITAKMTMPSEETFVSGTRGGGTWMRFGRYQLDDCYHFRAGLISHIFISVLYLVWYFVTAGSVTPVNPITDPTAYISQQILHALLWTCCAVLFWHNVGSTSDDEKYRALAHSNDAGEEEQEEQEV